MPATMEPMMDRPRIRPQPKRIDTSPNYYEKDFGHEAEAFVMDVLSKKGIVVKTVEHGTDYEDIEELVDFWLLFDGIDKPLGIQYTISTDKGELKKKNEELKNKNYTAIKEARDDAVIKYSGNANVVLVSGNKMKLAQMWDESRRKGVGPAEVADDKFVIDILKQILEQLEKINPALKKILMDKFAEIEIYRNARNN